MAAKCRLIVHGLIVTFLFASGDVDDNLQAETGWWMPLGRYLDCRELDLCGYRYLVRRGDPRRRAHLLFERLDRRREPSDADVRRAAAQYREWYGEDAFRVIGDHMLAASFAPDGRHTPSLGGCPPSFWPRRSRPTTAPAPSSTEPVVQSSSSAASMRSGRSSPASVKNFTSATWCVTMPDGFAA